MDNSAKEVLQIELLKHKKKKEVRDLCMFLNMPQLPIDKSVFMEDLLINKSETDYHFRSVLKPSLRLGFYAELLFETMINQNSEWRIALKNHQIISDKITIGEVDFLLKKQQQLMHLELACKFYIQNYNDQLIGPNSNDNWTKKKANLLYKQSCLVNKNLELFQLDEKVEERILVKSRVFKLNEKIETFYFAIFQKDIFKLVEYCKYFQIVDSKLDWIFPFYLKNEYFEIERISDFKVKKWLKISLYDTGKEPVGSGFILRNDWPN